VCALGLGSEVRSVQKRQYGMGLRSLFHSIQLTQHNITFIGHHTRSMEWSYTIIQRMIHGTKGSAGWAPAWSMLAVGGIHSVTGGTNAKKSVYSAFCSRRT
jgi:hypothetical protein